MNNFAAIGFETANNERTSVCSVGVVIGEKIESLIEGLPLVAHNSPFDEGCLKAVMRCYRHPPPCPCRCRGLRMDCEGVFENGKISYKIAKQWKNFQNNW